MKIQKEFMDKVEAKMIELMPDIFSDDAALDKMSKYANIYNNIKQSVVADAQASLMNDLKNVNMDEMKGIISNMLGR